ncbi:MAG: ABC transporter permease [Chloroflexi bacterium]|nr:ABC transporter permease [Chloroflexota bacterium]
MDLIWEGIGQAFWLLLRGDRETYRIILLSLEVSGTATLLSVALGLPVGTFLGLGRFRGRNALVALVNMGMGLPPVVVGLLVSIMLWRSGPLGALGLLYTPQAMVLAQFILAFPLVVAFTLASIQQLNPKLRLQILALGASRWQMLLSLAREAKLPLLAAVMAGFGAVISEVGASLMVGGNILGRTRVLTTATVMETGRGNFALAIALGSILLVLVYGASFVLTSIQQRSRPS